MKATDTATDNKARQKALWWVIAIQLLALIVLGLIFWLDQCVATKSLLLGAMATALPRSWFIGFGLLTWKMQSTPDRKTHRLYRGEIQQFLMTAAFCGAAFAADTPLNAAVFFAGFLTMMLPGWVLPAWIMYRPSQSEPQ